MNTLMRRTGLCRRKMRPGDCAAAWRQSTSELYLVSKEKSASNNSLKPMAAFVVKCRGLPWEHMHIQLPVSLTLAQEQSTSPSSGKTLEYTISLTRLSFEHSFLFFFSSRWYLGSSKVLLEKNMSPLRYTAVSEIHCHALCMARQKAPETR